MKKKLIVSILFQLIALLAISQVSFGFKIGVNKQINGLNLPNLLLSYQPTIFPEQDATLSYAFSVETQISRFFSMRVEPGYFNLNRFKKIEYSNDFIPGTQTYGTRFNSRIEYISLPLHFILFPTPKESKVLFKTYVGAGLGYISMLSSVGETNESLGKGEYINHPLSMPDIEDYPFEKRLYYLICFGMELGFKIKEKHAISLDLGFANNYFPNIDYAKYSMKTFGATNIGLRYMYEIGEN